ncbi:MAG: hypothetical protein IJW70_04690 [Clostridia bacterium]|nr:hypothetical protein [Clostridia bacterium]
MARKIIMWVLLIGGSVLTLIGVALMILTGATGVGEDDEIVVDLASESTQVIEFENLCLIPGESCEYTITLKGEHADRYELLFDFVELEEGTLKNFARVKIQSGDKVLYDELLAAAFEQEHLALPVDFDRKQNTELTIIYYLPIEVGNEAKNAGAVFELHVKASNE